MKKKYTIRITSVDYDITHGDIDACDEKETIKEIKRIIRSLPQKMVFQIKCEIDDLEGEIINAVSDRTGWLVNSVQYEIDPHTIFKKPRIKR